MNKNEKSRKNTLLKEVKSSWFYWMLALPGIAVLIAFSSVNASDKMKENAEEKM